MPIAATSDQPFFSGGSQGAQGYNDWNATGIAGPLNQLLAGSETGQMILDPMDLFGGRASAAQEQIRQILMQSAQANIAQQEAQQARIYQMYQPYYQAGLGALSDFTSMATGKGTVNYQPSALYNYQLKTGTAGINSQQAKAGLLHSSATAQRKSDLAGNLAAEEADRLYGGKLSQIQLGSGAADAINNASMTLGGNINQTYGQLGAGLNAAQHNYGQARQAAWGSLGNALGGLSTYQAQQGALR